MRVFPKLVAAVSAVTFSACLGSTYEVPRGELMRLAQTPPAQRGQAVRVTQEWSTGQEVPGAHVQPVVWVPYHVAWGASVQSNETWGGTGHHSGGGGGGNNRSTSASESKLAAALVVLAAIGAVFSLAATEGARYDGWVAVPPQTPVHLFAADGSYLWVPLDQLTPEMAARANEAFLADGGAMWGWLGRAPLYRPGLSYGLDLGVATSPHFDGDPSTGFAANLTLGGFPIQELGLFGVLGLGFADDDRGNAGFASHYGLEVRLMPIAFGRLHPGVYGQLGWSYRSEDDAAGDTRSRTDGRYAGGLLLELDLTTRLGLYLRGGVANWGGTSDVLPHVGVGLQIY